MERADQDGSRRTTARAEISRPEMGGDGATAPPPPLPHACKVHVIMSRRVTTAAIQAATPHMLATKLAHKVPSVPGGECGASCKAD